MVVLIHRCSSITEVDHGAVYSGLYRQVVLMYRCSNITEVDIGAVYSGLYKQVVFLYKSLHDGFHCTKIHNNTHSAFTDEPVMKHRCSKISIEELPVMIFAIKWHTKCTQK